MWLRTPHWPFKANINSLPKHFHFHHSWESTGGAYTGCVQCRYKQNPIIWILFKRLLKKRIVSNWIKWWNEKFDFCAFNVSNIFLRENIFHQDSTKAHSSYIPASRHKLKKQKLLGVTLPVSKPHCSKHLSHHEMRPGTNPTWDDHDKTFQMHEDVDDEIIHKSLHVLRPETKTKTKKMYGFCLHTRFCLS